MLTVITRRTFPFQLLALRRQTWLSAGELTRWGAEEVALAMPVGGS